MNLDNFTGKAEAYAKGRPGYPQAAIDQIMKLASYDTTFADIGAGTGKFTKKLAETGYDIYAVEPNADMRKQLEITLAPYTNVKILSGTVENTMLYDQSIDILTIAHALHWFDLNAFRKECNRVVKPGGYIIAIYNHEPGKELSDFGRTAIDSFFTNPVIWSFENPIKYTRENWLAYIASQDDSPMPGEPEYKSYLEQLNKIFDRDSENGILLCNRLTKVYCERI